MVFPQDPGCDRDNENRSISNLDRYASIVHSDTQRLKSNRPDAASALGQTRRAAVQQLTGSNSSLGTDETAHDSVTSPSFQYIPCPSLSHLLTIVLHPQFPFPVHGTSLLVIDNLSSLIDHDYPRHPYATNQRTEQQKWQAGRRYAILGTLTTALNRIATIRNLAVLVTTGCNRHTRGEDGLSPILAPGVGGLEWDAGIWSRIVLFRDFTGRFAGVQKAQGRSLRPADPVAEVGAILRFEIDASSGGILEPAFSPAGNLGNQDTSVLPSPVKKPPISSPLQIRRKRPFDEVADSDDEADDDYGWLEADENAALTEIVAEEHINGNVTPNDAL